jgi:ATP-dependent DNA helicase RecG
LRVEGGENTLYFYTGDGSKLAFYIIGNSSVPCPQNVLMELILKGQGKTFDALEQQYNFTDYTFAILNGLFKQKTDKELAGKKDYQSFGMVTTADKLTFVGALLADQSPVYQSRIFCTRWNGR